MSNLHFTIYDSHSLGTWTFPALSIYSLAGRTQISLHTDQEMYGNLRFKYSIVYYNSLNKETPVLCLEDMFGGRFGETYLGGLALGGLFRDVV